jgi:hypothetical protein
MSDAPEREAAESKSARLKQTGLMRSIDGGRPHMVALVPTINEFK